MVMPSNEVEIGLYAVKRIENPTLALPVATGDVDIFTITGGRILVVQLLGQVTTLIDTALHTVQNIRLELLPTTGAAALTPLCGVLDCSTDDVDTLYHITGTVANAMVDDARVGVAIPSFITGELILQPGTISMEVTDVGGVGDMVGAITWTMLYRALDPNVMVVAA